MACAAPYRELLADVLDGIGMQSKFFAAAIRQRYQVVARWPFSVEPTTVVLDLTAIVPNLVDLDHHALEALSGSRVLHAISKRQ